jgi:hypothetical protein
MHFLQHGKNKMATAIQMRHPKTGITKNGYIGFSYSYFFLGIFSLGWTVPLFRGDLIISLVCLIFHFFTLPLWMVTALLFGLFFNKFYTLRLIEEGYIFADPDEELVKRAKMVLGVSK